jgi:hypothetical protein
MHNYESGMFSGTECGGIVLCPRPRTFSVTPAMFAKQYSEHAYNGHSSGCLIVIALTNGWMNLAPECVR